MLITYNDKTVDKILIFSLLISGKDGKRSRYREEGCRVFVDKNFTESLIGRVGTKIRN